MKKLLALVLALIMVLGLGVTAFAVEPVAKLNVIVIDDEEDDDDEDPEVIKTLELDNLVGKADTYLCGPDGGDFYLEIKNYDNLKNITVSATGNVTAEIVEFDADTMRYPGAVYGITDSTGAIYGAEYTDGEKTVKVLLDSDISAAAGILGVVLEKGKDKFDDEYDFFEYVAKEFNAKKGVQRNRFSVVCLKNTADTGATPTYVKLSKNLLKVTVGENYTAAYKEGTVKVEAYDKVFKKDVFAELTIISDVSIFEFDQVNWAAENGKYLYTTEPGYSDYVTAKLGYSDALKKYDVDELRQYPNATVVSTTAFRAVEGEELTVAADDDNYVTIDEVAKGQKGVNFIWEDYKAYDEDDEKLATGKGIAFNAKKIKGDVKYITFGFLGNQVINSDFTIYVNPQLSYYQLRELFGVKVEEEDVITYYVLKDGVKIDEFTVDYANDDIDDDVELEILGKAGDKLGFYTLTLDAPAAEEEGEENPNTGAESVVGVVAAMAVISLATAAAVSLKK